MRSFSINELRGIIESYYAILLRWKGKSIHHIILSPTKVCHEPWRKNVESRKRICHNMLLLTKSNVMFNTKLDMWEELFNFCGMKKVKKDWQFSKKICTKDKTDFSRDEEFCGSLPSVLQYYLGIYFFYSTCFA